MPKSPLPKRRCPITLEANLSAVGEGRDETLSGILPAMEKAGDFNEGDIIMEHGGVYTNSVAKHFDELAEKFNMKIYGVEHTESMIEHAKENYPHPRVEYVVGDLTEPDFPLKDVKFNKIFSTYYLQLLPTNYKDELKAMYNLLVSGGQVVLSVWYHKISFDVFKYIKEHEDWAEHSDDHMPDMSWINALMTTPEEWKKEVQNDTGLRVTELTREEKDYTFEKLGTFVDLFMGQNTFHSHLSPEEKHDLREAHKKLILETPTTTFTPYEDIAEDHEYKIEYTHFTIRFVKD